MLDPKTRRSDPAPRDWLQSRANRRYKQAKLLIVYFATQRTSCCITPSWQAGKAARADLNSHLFFQRLFCRMRRSEKSRYSRKVNVRELREYNILRVSNNDH